MKPKVRHRPFGLSEFRREAAEPEIVLPGRRPRDTVHFLLFGELVEPVELPPRHFALRDPEGLKPPARDADHLDPDRRAGDRDRLLSPLPRRRRGDRPATAQTEDHERSGSHGWIIAPRASLP